MQSFGVKSAHGNLKKVIMHRPGPELDLVTDANLMEFNFTNTVDSQKFLTEYDIMTDLFQEHGVDILFITDILKDDSEALYYINHRPNMTYVRDLATVFTNGAVILSPHLKGRWGDQYIMEKTFKQLGVPILGVIESPDFLEGGGVTFIDNDTIVASLCDRANENGTRALREIVLGKEAKYFLEVPLPLNYIHIDGCFMVLDEKLCIIHPETFETFPCRLYEAGKTYPKPIMFREFLDKKDFKMIPIDDEEKREGHLNVVVTVRSKKAIGFKKAQGLVRKMKEFGWQLDTFPSDELFLGAGGAHCMTCPLLVE